VTNVAAFGAFVDIGVHQDGLVHVSAMSKTFVKDPREVVKPGDVVRVKVMEVDKGRKRIALSLRLDDQPGAGDRPQAGAPKGQMQPKTMNAAPKGRTEASGGAFADAFRRAGVSGSK
jgi:protein Tex